MYVNLYSTILYFPQKLSSKKLKFYLHLCNKPGGIFWKIPRMQSMSSLKAYPALNSMSQSEEVINLVINIMQYAIHR